MKYIFIAICFLFIVDSATSQTSDTTVSYFKNYSGFLPKKVLTADSADFVRISYPDSSDNLYNILEYYPNGTKKFIGKSEQKPGDIYPPHIIGDCIGYFSNGKKKYTAHYKDNKIIGLEYFFYPNGHLYAVKKWNYNNPLYNIMLYWECYDNNGNKICEDGNGSWLTYNADFSDVVFSGKIKKGLMNGEWQGYDILEDTVKYNGNYNMGSLISGFGYDKKGAAYPFKTFEGPTVYKRGDVFAFLTDLNRHLILPKNEKGKKINIDSVHISFIIEKDGRLDDMEVTGGKNAELETALNEAVKKCGEWAPCTYYGLPFRSRFVVSLKIKEYFDSIMSFKRVDFKGDIINSIKSGNSDSATPE